MSLQIWLPLNGSLDEKISGKIVSAATGRSLPSAGAVGKLGSGYTFSSSGIKIANIQATSQMSFAMWVKLNSNTLCHLLDFRTSDGNTGYQPIYYENNQIQIYSAANAQGPYRPAALSDLNWHHLTVTMQNSDCRLYVDGVLSGDPITEIAMYDNITTDLNIGCRCNGNNPCPGIIQDVRVYNHCLSPREVKLLAQGLVAHYKLDGNEIENPNLVNNSTGDHHSGEYLIHTYAFDRAGFGRYLAAGEKCTLTVCFTPATDFGYFNPHLNSGAYGGWMPNIYSDGTTNRQVATVISNDNWVYSNGSNHNINPENEPARANVCMYHRKDPDNAGSSGTTIHWIKLQLGEHPEAKTWTSSISENPNQYLLEDDCSGYDNHGTCSAPFGLTSDAPRYKNCKNFENNKYITTPARSYAGMKDSYTFSYWAKIPQIHGKMVFGFIDGNRLNVFPWNTETNPDANPDKSWFNWNTNDSANTPFRNNGVNVLIKPYNNTWHHYVITGNGSETKLYIDGVYTGTASSYKAIGDSNTQIVFSGYDTSANYKWNNGKISDFRIYATALSAAAVKELYQSSISFLDNGTLQCSEIVESPTNLKYNKNGITQAELISEIGYTNKMKIKTLSDGSAWARIHWLDVTTNTTAYFANEAEVQECINQTNRFSLIKYIDKFKSKNNQYEFMLTYPKISTTLYNRWTQNTFSNNVNDGDSIVFSLNSNSAWKGHAGPLKRAQAGETIYDCDNKDTGNWYAPIGQISSWGADAIPAANGNSTTETELWVRIDNLPKLTKLSMLDEAIQAYQIYEL